MANKTMSLGCESMDRAMTSCLSQFSGKYAEMTCEFCCTSHHYCNSLKSLDTVITDCLSLSLSAATNHR